MARQRRITELIKDEVEKPSSNQPPQGTIDVEATAVDDKPSKTTKSTATKTNSSDKNKTTATTSKPKAEVQTKETPETKVVSQKVIDPNPELEAKILKLQGDLDKATENAIALQEELASVKKQLSEQTNRSQTLERELQNAKSSAVHLAESNEKLEQEVNSLKQEKEAIIAQLEAAKPQPRDHHKSHIQPFKHQAQPQQSQLQTTHKPVYQPVPVRKTDRVYRDRFFARVPPTRPIGDNEVDEKSSSQMWLLD